MNKYFLSLSLLLVSLAGVFAQGADTTMVQTLTFDDITKRSGTWQFPDDSKTYQKILMYYTLKCDPATRRDNYPCGEWDYLTYTYIIDSTGQLDSTKKVQPSFLVDRATLDEFSYTSMPVYDTLEEEHTVVKSRDESKLTEHTLGQGIERINSFFSSSGGPARKQFLWRAAELKDAGLEKGDIQGLQFMVLSEGAADLAKLSIRIREVSSTTLNQNIRKFDFETVYSADTRLSQGLNEIDFIRPFSWGGTKPLIIEISHEGRSGDALDLSADEAGYDAVTSAEGISMYAEFRGRDFLDVEDISSMPAIKDEVTIGFWQYGDPARQPENDNAFEAFNKAGQRVLNVHLPWGDSKVYWDAGRDGAGYDRIERKTDEQQFMGRWNYWTFTKNSTTGEMKMYINGNLLHSGKNKGSTMEGITSFVIGASGNGAREYGGSIAYFGVWNKELNAGQIRNQMFGRMPLETAKENAVFWFDMQSRQGNYVVDEISDPGNPRKALISGSPQFKRVPAAELFDMGEVSQSRPMLVLEQGTVADEVLETTVKKVAVQQDRKMLVLYNDPKSAGTPTDTMLVWDASNEAKLIGADGKEKASYPVTAENTLVKTEREFYDKFEKIDRHEIARYITPYGINLTLNDGFTWIFDVTDYEPWLHGKVSLSAGNQQELIDLKFAFIEGTPPREVLDIETIYGLKTPNLRYKAMADDEVAKEVKVNLSSDASSFRIKTRTTGHGFNNDDENCAEFCPKDHWLSLNGKEAFRWYLWNECSLNPLYPQGGTWTLDRAGWCPGAKVKTYNHELKTVSPGDEITVDYGVQAYPLGGGAGNYIMVTQLISYGPFAHNLDASLKDIIAPNTHSEYGRQNPVCMNPKIKVENTGKDKINKLKLEFGVVGGKTESYEWEGELEFAEEAIIDLPYVDFRTGRTKNFFEVRITEVNGQADGYEGNNYRATPYEEPAVYSPTIEIVFKTNNAAAENALIIKDWRGNTVYEKSDFENDTEYRERINLDYGCHTLILRDSAVGALGNDGINYWFTRQYSGTGYFQVRSAKNDAGEGEERLLDNFASPFGGTAGDFGGAIIRQFSVGWTSSQKEQLAKEEAWLGVYPNPSQGALNVEVILSNPGLARLQVLDLNGKLHYDANLGTSSLHRHSIDAGVLPAGMYLFRVQTGKKTLLRRVVVN